jgi:hypothetical protein
MSEQYIPVVVDSIRANLMGPQRLITLREQGGERFLPIWIGPAEAEAIAIALRQIETIRPLTHDLLKNVIRRFGAQLVQVHITRLENDTFYAELVLEQNGAEIRIDCRPSDAIALALRTAAPILVAESVLQEAGYKPEEALEPTGPENDAPVSSSITASDASAAGQTPQEKKAEEDRLSIFEDFLENLDDDNEDE